MKKITISDLKFKLDYVNENRRFLVYEINDGIYLFDGFNFNVYKLPSFFSVENRLLNCSQNIKAGNIYLNDIFNKEPSFVTNFIKSNYCNFNDISLSDIDLFFDNLNKTNQLASLLKVNKNEKILKIINVVMNKEYSIKNVDNCKSCLFNRLCCCDLDYFENKCKYFYFFDLIIFKIINMYINYGKNIKEMISYINSLNTITT